MSRYQRNDQDFESDEILRRFVRFEKYMQKMDARVCELEENKEVLKLNQYVEELEQQLRKQEMKIDKLRSFLELDVVRNQEKLESRVEELFKQVSRQQQSQDDINKKVCLQNQNQDEIDEIFGLISLNTKNQRDLYAQITELKNQVYSQRIQITDKKQQLQPEQIQNLPSSRNQFTPLRDQQKLRSSKYDLNENRSVKLDDQNQKSSLRMTSTSEKQRPQQLGSPQKYQTSLKESIRQEQFSVVDSQNLDNQQTKSDEPNFRFTPLSTEKSRNKEITSRLGLEKKLRNEKIAKYKEESIKKKLVLQDE